jgi:ABC-type branched-subunit amino acid transport system substrate-binding protein
MRSRRGAGRVAIAAAVVGLLIAAGGCGRNAGDNAADTGGIRLYGSDGNMSNSFGEQLKDHPGVLAGMKGTTPLTRLSEDFKRRMKAVDPSLKDYIYGGEAYDAVVIAALATEIARTVEPTTVAKFVNGVTASGTPCESVKACLGLVRDGKDIAFRGVSLRRSGFTDAGEPSTASYGTLNFGRNNQLDDGKTEYVGAGSESSETKAPSPPPQGPRAPKSPQPLKIGGLLPHTGALAFAGPPMFAGARLAVNELNDAGGILGQKVEWVDGDDGTSPQVAGATVDRFIAAGVHVIIGASASGVCLAVLPKVVAAGRIMISPSATSDALTPVADKGLFFRTSPPDVLQAKALADILMRDGGQRLVLVAREDAYGTGLQHGVEADLKRAGVKAADLRLLGYPANAQYSEKDLNTTFASIAKSIKSFNPHGVLIVGFDESALVIKAMLSAGLKLRD